MNSSKGLINNLPPFEKPNVLIPSDRNKETPNIDVNNTIYNYHDDGDVFFAFIDVLGFKKAFEEDLIRDACQSESEDTEKSAVLYSDVFAYFFELISHSNLGPRTDENDCYAGQTSDTIYFYTKSPNILLDFLKIFSHLNLYAMTKNVFFRGGIAHGNLYRNEAHQFYGESVIRAYQMENDIAKDPVILIDQFTYESLCGLSDYPKEFIIKSKSKRNFLNPFALYCGNYDIKSIMNDYILREFSEDDVKKAIEDNIKKHEYDSRNYSKYIFLLEFYEALFTEKKDTIGGEVNGK